jgi:transcriptional regulator
MYVPRSFRESDPAFLRQFLRAHAFATLVTWDGTAPVASHLLLETRETDGDRLILSGHMSRENQQWKSFSAGTEALAIFPGPHAYISASWCSVPSAPTWNYVNVHAYGVPAIIEDRTELFGLLKRLVDWQEKETPRETRYRIESLPEDFLAGMMNGIVGFQIAVTRIEGAAKLSQNRNLQDFDVIIGRLKDRGDPASRAVAAEMEKRRRDSRDA